MNCAHLGGGLQRLVAAERRVRPALREEDVAGLLDLAHEIERVGARASCDDAGAQRMMQVAHAFEHPGFATPVRHVLQALEERSRAAGSRETRRADEREPRLAIGVLDALELRRRGSRSASGDVAHRQVERQIGLVGFGERQAGNLHVAPPDRSSQVERLGRGRDAPQRAEPGGLRACGRRPVQAGAQQRLQSRRRGRAIVGGREAPEQRAARSPATG